MIDHLKSDDHLGGVDLPLLHAQLGLYARQLWDIQKTRIVTSNRISAMEREDPPIPAEYQGPFLFQVEELEKLEKAINRQLERLAKQHFMADWIIDQPGIGLGGFARILGATGPLDNFPNVAKLWHYVGMHVEEGAAPKRRKGEKGTWSPQGRVICHQIADSIVKVGRGPWREAYDTKKAYYETTHAEWTPLHRHNAAMRYAIKELLKAMWVEWRRRQANGRVAPINGLPVAVSARMVALT